MITWVRVTGADCTASYFINVSECGLWSSKVLVHMVELRNIEKERERERLGAMVLSAKHRPRCCSSCCCSLRQRAGAEARYHRDRSSCTRFSHNRGEEVWAHRKLFSISTTSWGMPSSAKSDHSRIETLELIGGSFYLEVFENRWKEIWPEMKGENFVLKIKDPASNCKSANFRCLIHIFQIRSSLQCYVWI